MHDFLPSEFMCKNLTFEKPNIKRLKYSLPYLSYGAKMIPGMGKVSPKQMERLMRRMGMQVKEIPQVREVIIKTAETNWIFKAPQVTILHTPSGDIYQLSGAKPQIVEKEEEGEEEVKEEDIKLVMEQAKVSEEKAREALKANKGDIAKAIINLSNP
jgi:nascent polypeptide-associated complex subunit alpha